MVEVETTLSIFDCPKPIIAAINGPAVGVGVTMTLPMDIRLASEDAKFGFVVLQEEVLSLRQHQAGSCLGWLE